MILTASYSQLIVIVIIIMTTITIVTIIQIQISNMIIPDTASRKFDQKVKKEIRISSFYSRILCSSSSSSIVIDE